MFYKCIFIIHYKYVKLQPSDKHLPLHVYSYYIHSATFTQDTFKCNNRLCKPIFWLWGSVNLSAIISSDSVYTISLNSTKSFKELINPHYSSNFLSWRPEVLGIHLVCFCQCSYTRFHKYVLPYWVFLMIHNSLIILGKVNLPELHIFSIKNQRLTLNNITRLNYFLKKLAIRISLHYWLI